jgi:hypothetical protein
MVATSNSTSSFRRRSAADQQGQDDVITLAFEGGAVGHGQQLLGLLAGQPVAQPGALLTDVGNVGQADMSDKTSIPCKLPWRFVIQNNDANRLLDLVAHDSDWLDEVGVL